MKLKLLFFLSILIVAICILSIFNLLNKDFVLHRENKDQPTMNVWIISGGLAAVFDQFEDEFHVKVNIKKFRDLEALKEELALYSVNNEPPDMIEVKAGDGLDDIINKYEVYPIEEISHQPMVQFHSSIVESLSYKGKVYAYPLGIEIPLLYINQSLLKNYHLSREELYPFSDKLTELKGIQDRINNNHLKPFRMFHFDRNISFYWDAMRYSGMEAPYAPFTEKWNDLIHTYQLVPPLDSHMAITRFANSEIGALVSTSGQLQTIQELTGNSFEFDAVPFIPENLPILVTGTGLSVLKPSSNADELFTYLNRKEVQLQLLGSNGLLPAVKSFMTDSSFIHKLPMSKYINDLKEYEHLFVGRKSKEETAKSSTYIENKAIEIEKEIGE